MPGSVSFDRVADRYDETRGGERRGLEFAADMRPWLGSGPVLEVGVGTGLISAALAGDGTQVVGIDISTEMLRRAYGRLGPRVAVGDAQHLPIRDLSVGSVLFVMVLHLVGDVSAALAEAARVLRPGGRVVAVHGAPQPEHTDVLDALDSLAGMRRNRPDDEAVTEAAAAAGLGRIRTGWTSSYPMIRSPNRVADEIEERIWSYLWLLDEPRFQAEAAPAIRALRALPAPDRPRRGWQRHGLSVFQAEAPGSVTPRV